MTTTTAAAILAKMIAVIEALTPSAAPTGRAFVRSRAPNGAFRAWALEAQGEMLFRRFEVRRGGDRRDVGVLHPTANLIVVPFVLTIVYPANHTLYGLADLDALEDTIESDAHQIRDALFSVSALADGGHQSNIPTIRPPDRSDTRIWFQEIAVDATYFVEQRG